MISSDAKLVAIHDKLEAQIKTLRLKHGVNGTNGTDGISIKGDQGDRGHDGIGHDGKQGAQGTDGTDGADGADGVSITEASIAFDNHLVIKLSDGNEIDAGVLQGGGGGDQYIRGGSTVSVNAGAGEGGYEFTGGFVERTTGSSGSNDLGSNVQYTTVQAAAGTWKRFGFSAAQQAINDVEYWGETDPTFDQTKGLFGGLHMPPNVTSLINYTDTSLNAAVTTGSLQYTEAAGSYDLTQCLVGDRVQVRFSFNVVPQVANSTLEVALIFATRDASDNVTFTFPLTTQPVFFGTGSVGVAYLNRIEMSAYIASDEDRNSRALVAIRCNNEILIQPLSTLITVIR